jgi:acetyltransferase-like isoleucine patch superfamily enzyme
MSQHQSFFKAITHSSVPQIIVTLIAYGSYIATLSLLLYPSILLIYSNWDYLLSIANPISIAIAISVAFYIYIATGSVLLGILIRIFSLGIKPGKYPIASLTFIRWLVFSGFYGMAINLILPFVRMTFLTNLFYRLVGCKIGKNVRFNSFTLPDAYLLTLGDNVVIGAKSEITCHIFEGNKLILKEIKIGENSLIGAHCYILPGVEIGKKAVIGMRSVLRADTKVPDNARIGTIASFPLRQVLKIEKDYGSN